MKKVLLSLFLIVSLSVQADDAVSYFVERFSAYDKLSISNLSGKVLRLAMASAKTEEDKQLTELLKDIRNIGIVMNIPPTNEARDMVIKACQQQGDMLLSLKEGDEDIAMYVVIPSASDRITEFIMTIDDNQSITLISITGELKLKNLASLASNVDIDGMEHLGKIKGDISELKNSQLKTAINYRQFSIEALRIYSSRGTGYMSPNQFKRLDQIFAAPTGGLWGLEEVITPPPYFISVKGDSVSIKLPYCYIDAYTRLKFTDYKREEDAKGRHKIEFRLHYRDENFLVRLLIKPDGESTIVLMADRLGTDTYYGTAKMYNDQKYWADPVVPDNLQNVIKRTINKGKR